jgi:peptide deformylase
MAKYNILQYPDKRLKRTAVEVKEFGETTQHVIDNMFETHYATDNCAALAATQLDMEIPWRITVIDYSENKDQPLCLVNPKVVYREGEQNEYEGCMSVYPKLMHEKVKRAMKVKVQAQDRHGNPIEIEAEGYFAKCLQHEIDHLDGVVYVDHLHKIHLERFLRKMKKILRDQK